MPGYNHYSDCTCGWCVKTRGRSTLKSVIRAFLAERDAERLLNENGANRYPSSCFVIPNATCPVCGAVIYFYSNSNGSRVFFDDLGPPWPKHPCTDNPKKNIHISENSYPKIVPRLRGIKSELIEAATTLGILQKGINQTPGEIWRLLIIEKIDRMGWKNQIVGRVLDDEREILVSFNFTSSKELVHVGDFLSISFTMVSIVDPATLSEKKYKLFDLIVEKNL